MASLSRCAFALRRSLFCSIPLSTSLPFPSQWHVAPRRSLSPLPPLHSAASRERRHDHQARRNARHTERCTGTGECAACNDEGRAREGDCSAAGIESELDRVNFTRRIESNRIESTYPLEASNEVSLSPSLSSAPLLFLSSSAIVFFRLSSRHHQSE